LDDNHKASETNINGIKQAIKAGYQVVFATGRPYRFAKGHADRISPAMGVVANNGAYTLLGNYTASYPIPYNYIQQIITLSRAYTIELHFEVDGSVYSTQMPNLAGAREHGIISSNILNEFGIVFQSLNHDDLLAKLTNETVYTVVVSQYNNEKREDYEQFTKQMHSLNMFEIASFAKQSYDMTMPDANKGKALLKLCKHLGIDKTNLIVIGDSANDKPMFEVAGYSIAMHNAWPEIRAMANFISQSNNDNGVAYAIDHILQERR
jgi:Cof subfamily protein (haloacid dehalogenase superfamily)